MLNILIQYHPLLVPIAKSLQGMQLNPSFFSNESPFDIIQEKKPQVVITQSEMSRGLYRALSENPWIKVICIGSHFNEYSSQLSYQMCKVGRVKNIRPNADIISYNGSVGRPELKTKYIICEKNTPAIRKLIRDNNLHDAVSIRKYGPGWGDYGSCGIITDQLLKDVLVSSEILVTTQPHLVLNAILCITKVVYNQKLYGLKNIYESIEEANSSNYDNNDIGIITSNHTSFHVASELLSSVDIDLSNRIPRIEVKHQ